MRRRALLVLLVLATALAVHPASGAGARAAATPPQPALAEDLRLALTLHGVRCREVTEAVAAGEHVRDVTCRGGERYRIRAGDDGGIAVLRIAAVPAGAPPQLVEVTVSAPQRVLGFGAAARMHVVHVARHLFAIVILAGYECARVSGVERRAHGDHVVACSDGYRYRVRGGADGWPVIAPWSAGDQHP